MKRVWKKTGQLSGSRKYFRKWNDYRVGDFFIGKYVGTHIDTKYKKTCWVYEVLEANFVGEEGVDLTGKNLVVNAAGKLNKVMNNLAIGEIIQISYNGKSMMEGGEWDGSEAIDITIDLMAEDDGSESHESDDVDMSNEL